MGIQATSLPNDCAWGGSIGRVGDWVFESGSSFFVGVSPASLLVATAPEMASHFPLYKTLAASPLASNLHVSFSSLLRGRWTLADSGFMIPMIASWSSSSDIQRAASSGWISGLSGEIVLRSTKTLAMIS